MSAQNRISNKKIKDSIMERLREKGVDENPEFLKLVELYMDCINEEKLLRNDIKEYGVRIEMESSGGYVSQQINPAVTKVDQKRKQMIDILERILKLLDNCVGDEDEL